MRKVRIIAEAGVNHNGSLEIAKKLAYEAKNAGVDIVKYQTFNVDAITSRYAELAKYQIENIGKVKSQKEMLSELTLKEDDYIELNRYCEGIGIQFLSTPFDIPSVNFLSKFKGWSVWKIPSGEITNYPYLVEIAKTNKEIILSTGMSTIDEVENAVNVLKDNGADKISLMHCTTQYPTHFDDVNLRAMVTLNEKFGLDVGYSDHTKGIEVSIAAVAMGATVIEKHFTLDRTMEGPDHKASLEPCELKNMVNSIRHIEKAMGNGIKSPTLSEMENIKIARKSIVALRSIKKGELYSADNITTKRPGNGVSPMLWEQIIGTPATRDFDEDELIEM